MVSRIAVSCLIESTHTHSVSWFREKFFTISGTRGCPSPIIIWLWQFKAKLVDFKRPLTRSKLSINIGSRAIIC